MASAAVSTGAQIISSASSAAAMSSNVARGERFVQQRHQLRRRSRGARLAVGEALVARSGARCFSARAELRPILLALALQQADPVLVLGLEVIDQRIGRVAARTVRGGAAVRVLDREVAEPPA